MKKNSQSKSAFFNPRALLGLLLCSLGLAIAVFALIPGAEQPARETETQTGEVTESSERLRDMPTLGERPGQEAKDLDRLEQFWNDRLTFPTGKFDPAWVRAAAVQHERMKVALPAGSFARLLNPKRQAGLKGLLSNVAAPVPLSLSTTSFTSLGPSPENMTGCSGCYNYTTTQARVNAIAIDPTTTTNGSITAYIGSVGGGVWKTTNCCTGSTTWTITTDSPLVGTTAIDTIAIDPSNHNTIYAGTGDLNYGSFSMGSQGILKSTDGGTTWTVLGANIFGAAYTQPAGQYPQYASVGKVRVDPNNSNNIAAGTKAGLYLSHDGGNTWTQCPTNPYTTQRQDITGLELTNIAGTTRIIAAVGVRGFPTAVQYDLGLNGANGIYKATMPTGGCPTFTSIASNANGFVFGTAVTGSPYTTGANMNAGSGVPCNYPISGGTATYCGGASPANGGANNLSRIDIAVSPSNPNVIYAQVGSIDWNSTSGCGNTTGCELGVWVTTDGGNSWSFMAGSAGGSLTACTGSAGAGDYPQNWYDQGIAVDPNNPDRIFVDTFDIWFATRTGTSFSDTTCGYTYSGSAGPVHVDQHALAFLPGSSDILMVGNDGGVHATTNASTTTPSVKPSWINLDATLDTIEYYSGDIGPNFANASAPTAVGGAQDNAASSVTFSGTPTGPVAWQTGVGGDGFSGQIDPMGTGSTQAVGSITLVTGGASAGQQFQIGSQVFTFQTGTRSGTGQVTLASSTTTEGNNIVTAVNADLAGTVTAARSGSTVNVTAVTGGTGGNSITFVNGPAPGNNPASNFSMNGSGLLGGTVMGNNIGSLRYWEGNNSGGFSRCIVNCTSPGATWTSSRGAWTGDTQSFILPVNLFRGGIPGGDDCAGPGLTSGCGHLIAGTTRVYETISGAAATVPTSAWYVTNNPTTQNMTAQTLGNRSYINQVKYSPKYQSVAIVGTNDAKVWIGFNLGTGTAGQANWVDVTGSNSVLPVRPVNGITLDPSASSAALPVGYAAVGGFNANSTIPGHVFQVTCQTNCGTFVWADKTGNLPDIPVDSIIVNPNYPQQVFAGTDFGLYFTNDITQASPSWYRFNSGLPNVMIWDMSIDRGSTTLSVWTRGRGAFVYPLPSSSITVGAPNLLSVVSRMTHGAAGTFDLLLSTTSRVVEPRNGNGNYTIVFNYDQPVNAGTAAATGGSYGSLNSAYSGNSLIVTLTGVTDQQTLNVAANGVGGAYTSGTTSANVNVGFLVGDVNGDGVVNVADTGLVRSKAGVTLDNTNFQFDVSVDGFVNVGDTIIVRNKSGDSLP